MDTVYVKFAVLRASLREAWRAGKSLDERRSVAVGYAQSMEVGFKSAHQFWMALAMSELASELSNAPSLIAVYRRYEREILARAMQAQVPHSNTGPTGLDMSEGAGSEQGEQGVD